MEKVMSIVKNKDLKGVVLNLDKEETFHTNPDGSVVRINKIGDEYFSNRKKNETSRGSSWAFPNHLEYHGWLSMNGFVEVKIEELDDKWS
jgi:hypothetical protein